MKRKKSESGSKCCVSTCDVMDDGTFTYHQFPRPGTKVVIKNVLGEAFFCDRRKIWEDRVGQDSVINKYSKVCSLHFAEEDYSPKSRMQQSYRRLLATAVPSLYLPDEYSAFRKFTQKPKLLEQVDVNGNNAELRISSRLRRKSSNGKDCQKDVIPMKQLVQTDPKVKLTPQVVPNAESRLTAATTQQDSPLKSPEHLQESRIMFQDKYPPPQMPEDSPESVITETVVVIFKKEELDISENDIKLEMETEQVKLEGTKQEDEEFLDMLLMQTSYEMEKFTSGSCSTFAYV